MIGRRLGHWVIERELGRGGMGTVYLAHRDPAPASEADGPAQAALKILAPELAKEPGFLHRFQREVDALARLSHPNIVHLHEAGSDDGISYYAMEYVDGQNFEELLYERRRLPWSEVLDMALQVCPALKHAHDHGVIHRDLKPQNLLRTSAGIVKLTDFGIAKIFATRQLTATGGLVGTAEYLSPEQAAGKSVTARSDLYSLGAVMYTLLTGRPPFQGKGMMDLLHKHIYSRIERPQRLVPEIPHELDEIICRLLEKDPAHRPANGYLLQRELLSVQRLQERRSDRTVADGPGGGTREEGESDGNVPEDEPGAATIAARFVRDEAAREARPGPVGRLLNKPYVLIALLLLCLGVIGWRFSPRSTPTAESLFDQGSRLMASDQPAEWKRAWELYLTPLEQKYPNHPYREQMDEFRRRKLDNEALTRAVAAADHAGPASEAQRFFQRGLFLCQQGDIRAARALWGSLAAAFKDMPSEQRWVQLAESGLTRLGDQPKTGADPHESLRAVLHHARELMDASRPAEAEAVWKALEDLYRAEPGAGWVLEEIRRGRARADRSSP